MTLMGIGMVFFGLELMTSGFKPLRTLPAFVEWFHAFEATTYLGVLKCAAVGCLLTMIVQSSSATVGITMGLASTGMINFETAGALVLGENIGTTITAWLASLGTSTTAKRAAYAHICFNTLGVAWITPLALPLYFPFIARFIGHDPNTLVTLENGENSYPYIMAAIAAVHTGFNVANTLVFVPFVRQLAWLVTKIVPEKQAEAEIPHLVHLDIRMLDTPAISIMQSHQQIVSMAHACENMLESLAPMLRDKEPDEAAGAAIFKAEEQLDAVQKEVVLFLGELLSGQVPHDIVDKARGQMRMADEYESVSDYAASVLKGLRKLSQNQLRFAPEGYAEFQQVNQRVLDYLRRVGKVVAAEEAKAAVGLLAVHGEITRLIKDCREAHLSRVTNGKVTPLSSLVYTDMLNFYRRINDHALNIAEVAAGIK